MHEASNTFRLAIGVFDEAPRLAVAVGELLADGVTAAEICLVGTRHAIEGLSLATWGDGDRRGLSADNVRALAPSINGVELCATEGSLLHKLLEHTEAFDRGSSAAYHWMLPDLFGGLTEHLRAGAIALLIGAVDFTRQRRGSRILLRNTAHTVQTHEFTSRQTGTS